jgi:serine/threonine protein kinase
MEDEPAAHLEGLDRTEITELGIPYGTATYAAPEQAKGERTDHRADIFSTGVLLYEMLTGIWAFQGKTVIDVRHQVLYGTPKPLAEMRPGTAAAAASDNSRPSLSQRPERIVTRKSR